MDEKALDLAKKIMYESGKKSDYYLSEQEKLKDVQDRVATYNKKVMNAMTDRSNWKRFEYATTRKIEKLRIDSDYSRTWIHVDMDAFYAAVETRDDPKLADIPLAIEEKNMIMTTNYLAREFGVRSGIPGFIGKKLCPDLVTRRPNFAKYR